MTAAKAVGRVTEIIHRKHLAFTKERSYWARLRRYCDNLKGLLFYVPSEHQTEWFLTVLGWERCRRPRRKSIFVTLNQPRSPSGRAIRSTHATLPFDQHFENGFQSHAP